MRLNDQEITFNVVNVIKFPSNVENYNAIESLDCEEEVLVELFSLEEFLEDEDLKDILEVNTMSDTRKFQHLDLQTKDDRKNKPSVEEPPELELN